MQRIIQEEKAQQPGRTLRTQLMNFNVQKNLRKLLSSIVQKWFFIYYFLKVHQIFRNMEGVFLITKKKV